MFHCREMDELIPIKLERYKTNQNTTQQFFAALKQARPKLLYL